MNLVRERNIYYGKQHPGQYPGASFFLRFTDGAIKRGFIAFQIPSRESPVISPWFDGSQSQKHLILPDGNDSAYRKGIHIMNMAAPGANCPEAVFSLRNGFDKRISAHCAEMGNTGLSCHKNIRPDFFLTIRLAYV